MKYKRTILSDEQELELSRVYYGERKPLRELCVIAKERWGASITISTAKNAVDRHVDLRPSPQVVTTEQVITIRQVTAGEDTQESSDDVLLLVTRNEIMDAIRALSKSKKDKKITPLDFAAGIVPLSKALSDLVKTRAQINGKASRQAEAPTKTTTTTPPSEETGTVLFEVASA